MIGTEACPARQDLTDYALGKLPDDRSETIATHLSTCLACQEILRGCSDADDPLIASLRAPLVEDSFTQESGCREAIALVEAIGRAPSINAKHDSGEIAASPQDLGHVGQYHLLAKLGEGGMGTVYKALHTRLDKIVALKRLPRDHTQDSRAVARFAREMKAVGRLEHPNIVRAMDANEQDGTHYLVMEYVEGCDLSDLVRRHGPLAIADACELIRQAALGLQYAHENGLVHRDIKPSNLMLTRQGQVKILDLGLALLRAGESIDREMTGEGQMMGTADYIAPEQATDAHSVDIRADLYSLGCTLFKLLTGQAPFADARHKRQIEVIVAHLQKPMPSVRSLRPQVPRELASILERMTAKSPAERFATPAEVAAALEPFTAGCDLPRLGTDLAQPRANPSKIDPSRTNTEEYVSSAMTGTARTQPAPMPGVADHGSALATVLRGEGPAARGGFRRPILLALAAAAAAIPLMFGIWVIVRDKSGKEVGKMQIPDGGSATVVDEQGKPVTDGKAPVRAEPARKEDPAAAKTPVAPSDPQRRAAEAVLKLGGTVTVTTAMSAEIAVAAMKDLPAEPFALCAADLMGRSGVRDDDLKALAGVHFLTSLGLAETSITNAGLKDLGGVDIQTIDLVRTTLGDGAALQLTGRQDLLCFYMGGGISPGQITDAACTSLKQLPRLRNLVVGGYDVGERGLAELAALRSLRFLQVSCDCAAKGLRPLRALPNLQSLSLRKIATTDELIDVLRQFPQLRFVNLSRGECPDALALRLQKALPKATVYHPAVATSEPERRSLRWLLDNKAVAKGYSGTAYDVTFQDVPQGAFSVAFVNLTDSGPTSGAVNLCGLRCIEYLYWPNLKATDAEVEHIATLSTLVLLVLGGADLSDAGVQRLANLKQLEGLFLVNAQRFTDRALEHLTTLEHLVCLGIGGSRVGDEGLAHVGRINGLQRLDLDRCPNLTSEGLKHLIPLPILRQLNLPFTPIDDAAVKHLKQMSCLRILKLNGTKLTAAGIEELRRSLPKCVIFWDGGAVIPEAGK